MNLQNHTTPKPTYLLHAWGGFWNDGLGASLLGTDAEYFWFDSAKERSAAREYIQGLADKQKRDDHQSVVFDEIDGPGVEKRTVARMQLVLRGKRYAYAYDFGYGYDTDAARFMFFDGNYACDCNLSGFLADAYPEDGIVRLNCGCEITISDFHVDREADTNTPSVKTEG